MAQMYGNDISNLTYSADAAAGYKTSTAASTDRNTKAYSTSGNVDELLGYKYSRNDLTSQLSKTVSDGFEDYMKELQEKQKQENIDEESKEREQRKNEREIAGNLSHEELAQLSMMGIDVEGAKLSDLTGIVNTLRQKAHREETEKMMAQIAVSDGDNSGAMISGGNVISAVSGTELDVNVSDVIAAESKKAQEVEISMQPEDSVQGSVQTGSAQSSTEIDTQSADDTKSDVIFTENEFVFLVRNNLEANDENIYKAHFSGVKKANVTDASLLAGMATQLERVITQAGYAVNEESMAGAALLLDNELPVSTDNIRAYMELKDYFGQDSTSVATARKNEAVDMLAERLYEEVASIEPQTVYEMSMKELDVTIASAKSYGKNRGEFVYNQDETERQGEPTEKQLKAVSSMRNMEEIRLSMTMDAAAKMIKQDINIDTRELTQVVSRLKELEEQLMSQSLKRNGIEPTEDNIALVRDINEKIASLETAPAGVIAAPLSGEAFTVNSLNRVALSVGDTGAVAGDSDGAKTAKAGEESRSFETVRRSYEAAETKVRTDLGDSITKAFSNVDDILEELSMPVSYETERAVRILGYNSLEINEQNINDVIGYDRQVNTLIDNFYPEAVMGMIKDGINPLDVPIDELNEIIAEKNYNEGVTEAENFATYLRDVDNMGEITAEERESYIGIYRIMEKLSKSGDREAGWVFGNGSRLTVRNLIAAGRSRRAAGISVDIDDDFGMLSELNVRGSRIDAQIEAAFAKGGQDSTAGSYVADMEQNLEAVNDEETQHFMEANSIDFTMVNARAVYAMLNQNAGIYGLVSELLGKLKFKSTDKEDSIEEETENIEESLTGNEIENSISMESILESIGSESISLKYDDLRQQLTDLMYDAAATGVFTGKDISMVKTVMAGFNIMKNMAKEDHYQIPYETENGISVMNLTIAHDSSSRGSISISMSCEKYGELEADLSLASENELSGSITSASSEGNQELSIDMNRIIDAFAAEGLSAENVSCGQSQNAAAIPFEGEGRNLYNAAVSAVRALSSLL